MKIFCAFVSIFAVLTVSQEVGVCPDGWSRFYDQCYAYMSDKVPWEEAQSRCADEGGFLAEPDTECENFFLVGLVEQNGDVGNHGPWIGATRVEGEFHWNTNQTPLEYEYWRRREPNNWNGIEDCLHYWLLQWNDFKCDYKHAFICQKPVEDQ